MSSTIAPPRHTISAERTHDTTLRRDALRYVMGTAGAALFGMLVSYGLLAHAGVSSVVLSLKGWDFFYFFCSSRLIVEGHGSYQYDLHALSAIQSSLAYPFRVPTGVMTNLYPPYWGVALVPLALLPYTASYTVWLAVNSVLLAGSLFSLERYAGLTARGGTIFRSSALVAAPVLLALFQGQVSFVLLALCTASFSALRRGQDNLAGAFLALTIMKPQYSLPFLVMLAVRGHLKALVSFGVTALCLFAVPALIFGLSIDGSYLYTLLHIPSGPELPGFSPQGNRGFAGFAELLLSSPASTLLTAVLDLLALVLLVRCATRSRSIDLPFAFAMVVALLISPHVLLHDLTLLVLPVCVALRYRSVGPPYLPALLGLCYVTLSAAIVPRLSAPIQVSALAMAALALWLYWASLSARQEEAHVVVAAHPLHLESNNREIAE